MLPIHIGVNTSFDFTVYSSITNIKEYYFFPVSIFASLFCLIFTLKRNILVLFVLGFFTFTWCGLIYISQGPNIRLMTSVVTCAYFIAVGRIITYSLKFYSKQINEINGWYVFIALFGTVLLAEKFGNVVGIGVYDFSQYTAPLLASFVFGVLFYFSFKSLKYLVLGVIFWLLMKFFLNSATSTYIELSFVLAVYFGVLVWFLNSLKLSVKNIASITFWLTNIVYLLFILAPIPYFPKNHRDSILEVLWLEPLMLIIPFFKYENSYIYSAHSFALEGFRAFGVFFFIIYYFMINELFRTGNRFGSFLSLHYFTICGLFSMPQLHLYTIPILLILPHLKWNVAK